MTIIYLNQRRKIPRNPVTVSFRARSGSRMHPGWSCFMLAFVSGIFLIIAGLFTVQWLLNLIPMGFAIGAWTIFCISFMYGGQKAEKLWERE